MHISRKTNQDFDEPTTELYLPKIINHMVCHTHKKALGEPCYVAKGTTDEYRSIVGICNARAKAAGYNGFVQASSLDRNMRKGAHA